MMSTVAMVKAIELSELEREWNSACQRTQRSARTYFTAATFFLIGFVKYAYLVPGVHIPSLEMLLWLLSAALVPPALVWFGYDIWREWRIYRKMAAIQCRSGYAVRYRWLESCRHIADFVRTGRG